MKLYKANKNGFFIYLVIGAIILPILIIVIGRNIFAEMPIVLLPLIFPLILFLWIYFNTYYKIENDKLKYKSGFLRGEIDIGKINKIIIGKTGWSGIKPALAKNGLTIKYNRYDEIYIAPESNNEVVADLLLINRNIEIIE